MSATLLVRGCAPPTPSIWRGSGEPIAASSAASRARAECGRALAWKYRPLEVPPRISVLGIGRSMSASLRWRLRAVDEAALGELLAHVVDVEAELAFLQALTRAGFLGGASIARLQHVGRLEPRHDADAVVVGDHDIPPVHQTP